MPGCMRAAVLSKTMPAGVTVASPAPTMIWPPSMKAAAEMAPVKAPNPILPPLIADMAAPRLAPRAINATTIQNPCPDGSVYTSGLFLQYEYRFNVWGSPGAWTMVSAEIYSSPYIVLQ
jgi:hypothetical protein